jgi:hypothetical protein
MRVKLATVESVIAAALALQLAAGPSVALAASPGSGTPVIGKIVAQGAFRLDNATVSGNATLFEGATVESGTGAPEGRPEIAFQSGARVSLGAVSRGRFFGDHIVLERGQSRLEKAGGLRVMARGLTVQPETGNTTGRVELAGATRVEVAAWTGSFRVLNASGMVVAKIPTGIALAFEPQASSGPARITGRLVNKGGHYVLTDETTNVTVEVTGPGLAKMAGKRVEIIGSTDPTATPVSDASQLIRADSVTPLSGAGAAAAGSGGAAGSGAGGAASGLAISATAIAIIGGVAAAAVVGGLAAAGALGGTSPVSR